MSDARRREPRYAISLPIEAGGKVGTTRTLGVSDVSFETMAIFEVGSRIDFAIPMSEGSLAVPIILVCSGEVVRVDAFEDGHSEVSATIEVFRIGATEIDSEVIDVAIARLQHDRDV